MGKTIIPFSQLIDQEYATWLPFRRALRKEDQEHFDALFRAAKYQIASCVYATRTHPFEAMMMAMLVESFKAIQKLEEQLNELKEGSSKKTDDLRLDL